jgi:hypothetical protein
VIHARICDSTFTSVKDLNAKIRALIDDWNDRYRYHPFARTETADEILAKARRAAPVVVHLNKPLCGGVTNSDSGQWRKSWPKIVPQVQVDLTTATTKLLGGATTSTQARIGAIKSTGIALLRGLTPATWRTPMPV